MFLTVCPLDVNIDPHPDSSHHCLGILSHGEAHYLYGLVSLLSTSLNDRLAMNRSS